MEQPWWHFPQSLLFAVMALPVAAGSGSASEWSLGALAAELASWMQWWWTVLRADGDHAMLHVDWVLYRAGAQCQQSGRDRECPPRPDGSDGTRKGQGRLHVDSAELVTMHQSGRYPSDHYPVLARFLLT